MTIQKFIKQQRKYRRDGEIFPQTVEYNSQNLLGIYDAGNYGRFAPKVMKILFSSTEMYQSIIYSNSMRCVNGLSFTIVLVIDYVDEINICITRKNQFY
ncbi:unnamed protein product [Rotaria magnacalcarata]|uniref:Uncharacterized protein n=2 Tax=Rotaria magnacalcarata TaxID=392030 RepID=A0A8S3C5H2_9BILA|nr:unnamed protein product [Rotaria magnacalcarata]